MKKLFKKIIIAILYLESKIVLNIKRPTIIAITGTVGKTTTKDIIFAGLKDNLEVRKSQKGFNSDIGVLLSVLNLETHGANVIAWVKNIFLGLGTVFVNDYPEVLVLEVGANYPGEIKKNAKLLRPDIVILTRLPKIMAHMEFFENRQHFINEKLSLVRNMKKGGSVIYNADDSTIVKELNQKEFDNCKKITFGKKGDIIFDDLKIVENDGCIIGTNLKVGNKRVFLRGVLGSHLGYPVCALFGVAKVMQIDEEKVLQSLQNNFVPSPGRMRVFSGINGSTIIDDSYNALPESVKNGSELLRQIKVSGRKIYVLGRLAELGEYTEKSYKSAVDAIYKSCDVIFLVNDGGVASGFAGELNFKEIHSFNKYGDDYFANTDEVGKFLKGYLKKGDIVIFKGARHSTGFERAIAQLVREEDKKYLVQDHLE